MLLYCSGFLFALVKPTPKTVDKKDKDASAAIPLQTLEAGNEESTLLKEKEIKTSTDNSGSSLKTRIL